ncbi:LeuA family protein [Hazenella coriacea]|uniref:2-isopropylmalate synthase n=1 Tax=Hazenella coriacea TaxID=1179467 RepID=A0A4R3L2S5_9BACL|nr:2-isopropylmalate synthase [Hazenella coriacea]TCS93883.1 2-isopropylmalate synthase [Hazenella coriacea]
MSIKILDSTLREGEQHPGVRFSADDKIHLIQLLEEFHVDYIEIGHPAISPEDAEICKKAAQAARKAEILMHARAVPEEIKATQQAGAHWVGIWASINPLSLTTKFRGKDKSDIAKRVIQSIEYAKQLDLKVRFTIEDASRTEWEDIQFLASLAVGAGADRISLADTTGVWEPYQCAQTIKTAVDNFPCEIEVHLHNDFGLATANALAAIEAGASVIDTSILGIGERSGIVDLLQLAVILQEKRADTRFSLEQIPLLSQAVQMTTHHRPDSLRPITGRHAFTHTATYHRKAVSVQPESYEAFEPTLVGRTRQILERPTSVISKLPCRLQIGKPFPKGSSELKYHTDGPGKRWVLMDHRVDSRTSLYAIKRFFNGEEPERHVDQHVHNCDSVFIFWGENKDGTGLTCAVQFDGEEKIIHSPASIFIPSGVEHSYYYIEGKGTYTNIVLAPEYHQSLAE